MRGNDELCHSHAATLRISDHHATAPNRKQPAAPTLVEIRKLSKYYQRGEQIIPVLVDINLDVGLGDFVALMGPSGSGKSTLSI